MATSYDISTGSGRVEILQDDFTSAHVQLNPTSLDAEVTVYFEQSEDDANYVTIDNTTKAIESSAISLDTTDYTLSRLYLYFDVGSATTGTVEWFISDKKKVDNTGTSPLDVTVDNPAITPTNFDSFGRLRVSQIKSQADLKQIHDNLPLFYDTETVGTGAVNYNTGFAESTLTTTATGDYAIMQTKQRYNYSSGKSSIIFITFRNFNTQSKIEKNIGYFNTSTTSPYTANKDGLYLQNKGGNIRYFICNNGTCSNYVQSSWDDPMDGTGASGVDLQLGTDAGNYIMWMDYEWLGVGKVRFGFIKDGVFYVAHAVDHILDDGVYMSSPNHSIRAEINAYSTGTSGTLRLICATYGTEGDISGIGKILSDNMGSTHVDANSTSSTYALMGIRLGSSYLDTLVDILGFSLLAITNDNQRWEIWLNPTVAGTFTYTAVANSSLETAKGSGTGNTVTTTGATLIDSGYITASSSDRFQIESAIRLGATIAGVQDEMVLCTTPLSSNSDVIASLTWREIS